MTTHVRPHLDRARTMETAEAFRFVLPVRLNPWSRILVGIWLAVCVFLEVLVLRTLFMERSGGGPSPFSPFLLVPFLAALTAAGLFLAWRLDWLLFGREIVDIGADKVRYTRRSIFPGRWIEAALRQVDTVRVVRLDQEPVYPSWGRQFVGKGPYRVSFRKGDHEFSIGRGVEETEARRIAQALSARIRE